MKDRGAETRQGGEGRGPFSCHPAPSLLLPSIRLKPLLLRPVLLIEPTLELLFRTITRDSVDAIRKLLKLLLVLILLSWYWYDLFLRVVIAFKFLSNLNLLFCCNHGHCCED
ncbi:uncharacterized protein DS421_1g17790 [Arachis hypogaea]|nr:uncharacterized protein DS421_1g17790 [Arachis hypogaea]